MGVSMYHKIVIPPNFSCTPDCFRDNLKCVLSTFEIEDRKFFFNSNTFYYKNVSLKKECTINDIVSNLLGSFENNFLKIYKDLGVEYSFDCDNNFYSIKNIFCKSDVILLLLDTLNYKFSPLYKKLKYQHLVILDSIKHENYIIIDVLNTIEKKTISRNDLDPCIKKVFTVKKIPALKRTFKQVYKEYLLVEDNSYLEEFTNDFNNSEESILQSLNFYNKEMSILLAGFFYKNGTAVSDHCLFLESALLEDVLFQKVYDINIKIKKLWYSVGRDFLRLNFSINNREIFKNIYKKCTKIIEYKNEITKLEVEII